MDKPPKSIIEQPELQVYIADFGKPDDWCLVVETKAKIVGAVWVRIMLHIYVENGSGIIKRK